LGSGCRNGWGEGGGSSPLVLFWPREGPSFGRFQEKKEEKTPKWEGQSLCWWPGEGSDRVGRLTEKAASGAGEEWPREGNGQELGFVVVSWGRNGCGSNNPQSSRSGQGALVLSFSKKTLQRRLNREREACV
jgi:hypothetical protein